MRQHISYSEGSTACEFAVPTICRQTAAAASPTPLPVTGSHVIAGDEMSMDGHDDGKPDTVCQHRREQAGEEETAARLDCKSEAGGALCGWCFGLDGRTIALRKSLSRPMPEVAQPSVPHGVF